MKIIKVIFIILYFTLPAFAMPEVKSAERNNEIARHLHEDPCIIVGVYRLIDPDRGDLEAYEGLRHWVLNPKTAVNKKTGAAPADTFVLVSAISSNCPSYVNIRTIYIDAGVGDVTPRTFVGMESSAYILTFKKDKEWENGDLYSIVGGFDSVIAKRDAVPAYPNFTPRYQLVLDPVDFDVFVEQLRRALRVVKKKSNHRF